MIKTKPSTKNSGRSRSNIYLHLIKSERKRSQKLKADKVLDNGIKQELTGNEYFAHKKLEIEISNIINEYNDLFKDEAIRMISCYVQNLNNNTRDHQTRFVNDRITKVINLFDWAQFDHCLEEITFILSSKATLPIIIKQFLLFYKSMSLSKQLKVLKAISIIKIKAPSCESEIKPLSPLLYYLEARLTAAVSGRRASLPILHEILTFFQNSRDSGNQLFLMIEASARSLLAKIYEKDDWMIALGILRGITLQHPIAINLRGLGMARILAKNDRIQEAVEILEGCSMDYCVLEIEKQYQMKIITLLYSQYKCLKQIHLQKDLLDLSVTKKHLHSGFLSALQKERSMIYNELGDTEQSLLALINSAELSKGLASGIDPESEINLMAKLASHYYKNVNNSSSLSWYRRAYLLSKSVLPASSETSAALLKNISYLNSGI